MTLQPPRLTDALEIWRLCRDTDAHQQNSSYFYALWCRDFSTTSVVAKSEDGICGVIVAYTRPAAPDTLFLWQAAVSPAYLGGRLTNRMLDYVVGIRHRFVECATSGNALAVLALSDLAATQGAPTERSPLFSAGPPADGNEPEELLRVGPLETL